jgi:hypothetical protein
MLVSNNHLFVAPYFVVCRKKMPRKVGHAHAYDDEDYGDDYDDYYDDSEDAHRSNHDLLRYVIFILQNFRKKGIH